MLDPQSTQPESKETPDNILRLHIGGTEPRAGWKILNVQPGPNVDFVGSCTDLTPFSDNSVAEVYASHVYEHLGHQHELPAAFKEVHRVLRPEGIFRIAVPDLSILCQLLLNPQYTTNEQMHIMNMMYGGQIDPYDFHKVGLTWELMMAFLANAGFRHARRVKFFGLFEDCSTIQFKQISISLNVNAFK